MIKYFYILLYLPIVLIGQQIDKVDKIELIHADKIQRLPSYYNNNVFYTGNVVFEHDNGTMEADTIVLYQKEENLKAFSNVLFTMDSNKLTADEVNYNSSTNIAQANGNVILRDVDQTLYTDKLEYNRNTNKVYYNTGGTIISKDNVITSQIGIYDVTFKTNVFEGDVRLNNEDYYIEGKNVIHSTEGDFMEFNDETFIQNKDNPNQYIETTKGKYFLGRKEAYLENRSTVHSDGTTLTADDIFFDQNRGFGKGEGDVIINNIEDEHFIRGGLGEFYREQDSAFVTQEAYAVKVFKNDSFYLHADTLLSTKRLGSGIIRAFNKAKYFKSDLQGKADSIVFLEETGELTFFKDPVVWSGFKQITGDTIVLYSNVKLEQMDSIEINGDAFAISKTDSITQIQFHQLKSRKMLGIFLNEQLDWVEAKGNAQSLLYVEDDEDKNPSKDLIGINRSDCGIIEATFEERQINIISCKIKAQSKLYPPSLYPEDERKLSGFEWLESDRPKTWREIFN